MKGHQWFAALFDRMNRIDGTEKFLAEHRPYVAGEVQGRVLEIGAGTGANLPYFSRTAEVIASEPDPFMLERAKKRLQELGPTNIDLVQFPAENIPYEDGSFDHVVSSMVFCSVADPRRALAEVRRVLKPTGTFRFIEHVRARNPAWGRLQDLILPIWSWLEAGCHPNRRTLESMREAGFEVKESRRLKHSIVPVVVGVAVPAAAPVKQELRT